MLVKSGIVAALLFFWVAAAVGFETNDLKGPEALKKMEGVWDPVSRLREGGPELTDSWRVLGLGDARSQRPTKIAAVKNFSGDILYLARKGKNEIVMTFVSSDEILFIPPFQVYVDAERIFDARDKGMLPIMAGKAGEYSGFSVFLNKDYEDPGRNPVLKSFSEGKQAVFEFVATDNASRQAAFSLKGSNTAIAEILAMEY